MGLGKTAQSIVYLAVVSARAAAAKLERKPHLVIAPVSVLENWQREFALWAPSLRVACLHGPTRAPTREAVRAAQRGGAALPFDVLLTSYTAFERDSDETKEDRQCMVRTAAAAGVPSPPAFAFALRPLSSLLHSLPSLTSSPPSNPPFFRSNASTSPTASSTRLIW